MSWSTCKELSQYDSLKKLLRDSLKLFDENTFVLNLKRKKKDDDSWSLSFASMGGQNYEVTVDNAACFDSTVDNSVCFDSVLSDVLCPQLRLKPWMTLIVMEDLQIFMRIRCVS